MNFIKSLKFLLIGAMVAASLTACTDLEVVEVDSILVESTDGFVAGNPGELLNSAYTDLGALTDQANIYSLYAHTSDEMIPPTRGVDWGDNGVWRTLHAHTWDPTHAFVLNSWNQLHSRAFKCNQILASNPSAQQAAEAKFLRAFYMYHAMDLFGQVPFREVTEGVGVDPRVLTRSEAYDRIVADLKEALPQLPSTGPASTNPRATQAAANALLARVVLNKAVYKAANPAGPYTFDNGDMAEVIQYCDAVTAAGYALEDNYFKNFSASAASEIIFTSAEGSPQNRYYMSLHYNQNPSGWNGFTTLADFYAKFEANDVRRGITNTRDGSNFSGLDRGFLVGQQFGDDGTALKNRSGAPLNFTPNVRLAGATEEQGIRVVKYHPSDQGQYILLRYADVYLMKAEAMLRSGNAAGALDMVNQLRAKHGASALGTLTEAALLDERGRELYWEGVRRIDQVRFGTFTSTWAEKTNTEAHRVLFPIPQQALDSNPNLKQNDGY